MEKRQRSPNYPALGLREAVDKARMLHQAVGRTEHDRETVARGMGYRSLSGASATAVSALRKYGLLEGRNDEIQVSDRAMAILFAHTEEERREALREAALEPTLFSELAQKFPGDRINDELVKNYLIRNGFGVQAADGVISAFKETLEFVGGFEQGYDSASKNDGANQMPTVEASAPKPPQAGGSIGARAAPVVDGLQRLLARYDFEGGGHVEVRVTGEVDTDSALDMVETLIQLKRKELERRTRSRQQKEIDDEPDA